MKLLRLNIENFGKLSGYIWELEDGLNTVCQDNGFGKSTLAAFIKAMLYGLPASTKRNLDKNERKKYLPWQGGAYGGSLEFECAQGSFRIERFFGAKEANDEFRLFDLTTNKPSDAFSQDVGIELFGIDAEGFARSAFLSQSGMDNNEANVSVTAKLTGLLEDVNDMGSYDVAMESIDKRRKFYEVKGGRGRVSDLNTSLTNGRRELDRLNELLIHQKRQEADLLQVREQIASTEQTLTELRDQIHLTELYHAHQTDCERLKERIGQAEEQRRRILSAFRDGRLPSERELAEAQHQLKEFRVLQSQCNALGLTPEESEALERLQQRYPKGKPTMKLLTDIQDAARDVSDKKAALQAFVVSPPTESQRHFEAAGIPSDAMIAQMSQKLDQADHEKRLVEEIRNTPKSNKKAIRSALSWIALVLGAILIAVSFVSPVLKTMLLIFGIMSSTVGAILLLTNGEKKNASRQAEEIQRKEKSIQILSADVERFLSKYGFLPSQGELRQGLLRLTESAHRATADTQRQQAEATHRQELVRELAARQQHLQSLFAECGAYILPEDPHGELIKIHTDLREWDTLSQKRRTLQERVQQSQAQLKQMQDELSDFISLLIQKNDPRPEACLEQMESLCRSYAVIQESIRQQQQDLLEREEACRQVRPSRSAADADLKTLEKNWLQKLDELRNSERELHRQWTHSTEQTQKIPQLEDELTHLSTQLGESEHNLNLLRLTAQFLTDSKEALSTRYLGGMQEHFAHYRALAEGENASEAVIDTSFSVSVREAGKSRELESFSRGSRDMLQFCARLALVSAMFEEGEKPFLLLDDPFVNLDETHFASVRALLDKLSQEFQILYFVCHSDRC